MRSKKGLSTVIATVLIIMITIIAFVMIATVIIPMIKSWLCDSRGCYDLTDQILVNADSDHTCSNSTNTEVVLTRGLKDINITSIKIAFRGSNGDSQVFDLVNGSAPGAIWMVSGGPIQIPPLGGSRSYMVNGTYNYVVVSPSIKGDCVVSCKTSESTISNVCGG